MSAFIHIVSGGDATMVGDAVLALIDEAVGDGDRTMMVDSLTGDDYDMASVSDAARTPPFLTDRRVVVARGVERFKAGDDFAPIIEYLTDPLESTVLIIEVVGTVNRKLSAAIKKAGGTAHKTDAPQPARQRSAWFTEQVKNSGVNLNARGVKALSDRLGEDVGRMGGVLTLLASAYGDAEIGEEEVAEFAGVAGSAKPWDLTDAIDKGDVPVALRMLHRMLHAGDSHPLQIMASLSRHYGQMMRLDGSDLRSGDEAASVLGVSKFPAQKLLAQANRLGSQGIARAMKLLSDADVAIRGTVAYPREIADDLVMEVLVTRLCRLSR